LLHQPGVSERGGWSRAPGSCRGVGEIAGSRASARLAEWRVAALLCARRVRSGWRHSRASSARVRRLSRIPL